MTDSRFCHRGDRVYRYVRTEAGTYEPQALIVARVRGRHVTVRTTSGGRLRLDEDDIYPPSGGMSPETNPMAWNSEGEQRTWPRRRPPGAPICVCGRRLRSEPALGYVHEDGRLVGDDGHWVALSSTRSRANAVGQPVPSIDLTPERDSEPPPWKSDRTGERLGAEGSSLQQRLRQQLAEDSGHGARAPERVRARPSVVPHVLQQRRG